MPSLNRDFSAPIRLVANLGADDLEFLAAHDNDPFNRWQAVQVLATRLLVDNVAALRSGGAARDDAGFLAALGAILADPRLEPAFVAQVLTPPGEADIARDIGRDIDPDAIFAARAALRAAIGTHLARELSEPLPDARPTAAPTAPMRPAPAAAHLRNVCLDLLVGGGAAVTRSRSRPASTRPPTT